MGALLSVPLMATPAVSMVGTWIASCCGAAAFSALCSVCGKCSSSIATRIGYAVLFLVNSILSWIMLTDWAVKKLEHLTLDYMKITCLGGECYGFVAVHRINFALALFHVILAGLLVGVHSSRNPRAGIQNGYWGVKIFGWLALIVVTFLIPDSFFVFWGNHIAMIFSFIFILIGLVLLVDFAHSWAETCLLHVEENDSNVWRFILVGSTLGMYVGSLVLTILMYVFFASSGCSMNQAAITINLVFTIIVSVLSINPTVQEYNPQAGLAQSAMVSIYCAYLTMSAVAAEPDDKFCNPLIRSRGTRTASIVLGAIFTFLAIAYTTTRAATQSSTIKQSNSYEPLESEHSLVTQEPSRSTMRAEALRSAVESGALPASALNETNWEYSDSEDEDDAFGSHGDDEKGTTKYNYVLFHLVFFLATQWTATLLTMNVEEDAEGAFVPVGRTYFSSWTKIVSAWICFALYAWTLVAPVLFPDRF
ncbi:Tms1p [Sugiyamaella lignohabitans]|uniref:Tms1p n=1 Tax=Sugiyamaella lignohabitans TaxID=796027 RepID=A0A167CCP4_9ASCO|nr:Tms1p [Sugiyamaella lignohabitans]ANB11513.1 Tms1p [Sugiyamaella lignohabitans]